MDKKTFHAMASSYIDNELSAADRRRFEAMLRDRPELSRLCDDLRKVSRLIQELPKEKLPPQVRQELRRRMERLSKKPAHHFDPPAFRNDDLRDPHSLLNAYVDGELASKEREYVETHLLGVEEYQRLFKQLQRTSSLLSGMNSVKAPRGLVDSVLAQVQSEEAAGMETALTDDGQKRPFGELLSAYSDGEVSPQRRKLVERKLKKSPKTRKRLEEFQICSRELASLPKAPAPAGAVDQVVDWLKRHEPGTRKDVITQRKEKPIAARQAYDSRAKSERKDLLRTAGLLAASLLLGWAVVQYQGPDRRDFESPQVALRQPGPSAPAPVAGQPEVNKTDAVADSKAVPPAQEVDAGDMDDATTTPADPQFYVLRLEDLKDIKAGEVVEVMNHKQVKLVCLDVERVYNRLRLVMMNNNVPVVSSDSKTATPRAENQMYVLDIATSPDQISGILSELWESERHGGPLVSSVDITQPSEELLEDVQRAEDAVVKAESAPTENNDSKAGPQRVPRIDVPQRALGNLPSARVGGALELTLPKSKSNGKKPAGKAPSKNRTSQPPADENSQPSNQTGSKSDNQVRVLFVLEPNE